MEPKKPASPKAKTPPSAPTSQHPLPSGVDSVRLLERSGHDRRHWPNRSALVIDACSRMTDGEVAAPDTGSLEGDVGAILTNIAELLGTARWSSIVPSIVDAAEHDPAFADIHGIIQRGHAAPLRMALDRAARRGEIPTTADRNAIAAVLLGPLFCRRWFSREPIDAKFLETIIRSAISGLRQDTRGPKRERSRR